MPRVLAQPQLETTMKIFKTIRGTIAASVRKRWQAVSTTIDSVRNGCRKAIADLKSFPYRALWDINHGFWFSPVNRKAWFMLVGIIVLLVTTIEIGVILVKFPAHIAQSFEKFNYDDILYWTLLGAGLAVAQQVASAYYNGLRTILNLRWRQWLSGSLIRDWYDPEGRPYIGVMQNEEFKKTIPNPDYIFTQDPDSDANLWTDLALAIGDTGLRFFSYGILLFEMSKLLSATAVLAAAVNYVLVIAFGKRLFKLSDEAFNAEAALKVTAGRARTEGDAIAFADGEAVAREATLKQLDHVVDTWDEIRKVNRRMQWYSGSWNAIMPYAPYLIMLFVFRDHVFFGFVISATATFQAFYSAVNAIPDRFGNIANLGKSLDRMTTLKNAINWCCKDPDPANHIQVVASDSLAFDKVTILTPDGKRALWKELSLTLKPGSSLLAIAPHIEAQGLTSLLKATKGLYNKGSGTLHRPTTDKIMYLTQSLDLTPGSLRQVLSHPKIELITDDALLMQVLSQVNLSNLVKRATDLDTVINTKELSTGEQQRLVLARILLRRPAYVLIESSGLDESEERVIYMALRLIGATVLTAGVPSRLLLSSHDSVLELLPDGNWKQPYPASEYKDPEHVDAEKQSS